MLISVMNVGAATPDQLYQSWQRNYRQQPDAAEQAAKDYLMAAPTGPHAHGLQIWLDAYHKNLDSFLSRVPRSTKQGGAPNAKMASAQAPRQAAPPQPPVTARPPEPAPASVIAPPDDALKPAPSKVPQNKAPAAKSASRSLPELLAFIANSLDDQGKISFTAQFHDLANRRDLVEQLSYEASQVTIDPNQCRIAFRWHVEQDQTAMPDQTRTIELRLAKAIKVETIDRALTDLNAEPGRRFSVRAHPQIFAVHIDRWDRSMRDNLYFRDREMAARISEAAKQALDLCDDGDRGSLQRR
jgi:hypothetical protein